CPAEVVRASLAGAKEPSSVVPPLSAAPTKEEPSLSVALATTDPAVRSAASSQDALMEESMALDYADNSSALTNSSSEMTLQVVSSPSNMAVTTDVASPAIPEAGPSGSIDIANAVSECWVDIVSNKEVVASKMDEWVG
ncbi:hypothetical protein C0989_006495, partial [Termitomyces sp. Mn162]